jgi:HrpA-like RNA helicase
VKQTVDAAIKIHLHEPEGDVLAFLTGFEECEKACKVCIEKLMELNERGKEVAPAIIIPLYGA